MAQTAKFIDVTRTFVPVDPDAFPLSLHTGNTEASPEDKIPVMAYKGYNFLPTSYGYKSYFGVNSTLDVTAIPARVDQVFVFQNSIFENILVALTEVGIFIKKGEVAGDWIHTVVQSAPATGLHRKWTYAIIANNVYLYRAEEASYQKIVSSVLDGVTITSIVPTFLNMAAQVGIFRAAGRLAFWDTDSSIGWSNLDDFADFSPSLETLAGNVKFSDIQGSIVTIQAHGAGFIIYSTKSIVFVAQHIENLFQWKPTAILSNAGVSYPRQVAVGSPDTLHFAYTTEGLKKIDKAREETIVPEITDFMQGQNAPTYLDLLGGRYLFMPTLTYDSLAGGKVQGTEDELPPIDYVFPGINMTVQEATDAWATEGGQGICATVKGLSKGFSDQGPLPAQLPDPSSVCSPTYTAYISQSGIMDASNITWVTPCGTVSATGTPVPMSPAGITTTANIGTTSANKRVVPAADAWVVGGWTMERFVQVQTAIWNAEAAAIPSVIGAIVGKSHFSTAVSVVTEMVNDDSTGYCEIGEMITEWSEPKFGWSPCEFWLTRYALAAVKLRNKTRLIRSTVQIPDTNEGYSGGSWTAFTTGGGSFSNADPAVALSQAWNASGFTNWNTAGMWAKPTSWNILGQPIIYVATHPSGTTTVISASIQITCPIGTASDIGGAKHCVRPAYKERTTSVMSNNLAEEMEIPPIADTGYCELSGWKCSTAAGGTVTIASTGNCEAPASYPAGSTRRSAPMDGDNPLAPDGSFCGLPFEPFTIPGNPAVVVNWPTETVSFPPGSFLMLQGGAAPLYPVFVGALVYDLHLKKWGKMKARHKLLLDYSPINSTVDKNVPIETFGIKAGILKEGNRIALFDDQPLQSYISYGKVGYYRLGNTSPEEIIVNFNSKCTGYLRAETSLNGHNLTAGLSKQVVFSNSNKAILRGAYPGRWCNITIGGLFDISYLEYRGFTQGRR